MGTPDDGHDTACLTSDIDGWRMYLCGMRMGWGSLQVLGDAGTDFTDFLCLIGDLTASVGGCGGVAGSGGIVSIFLLALAETESMCGDREHVRAHCSWDFGV